jgi:hypothetical protein
MKHTLLGLLAGGLMLALAATASAASVSVQIEGQSTVLPPTAVQTPASVTKDGTNSCPGGTAVGALDAATAGDWSGPWSTFGGVGTYTPEVIRSESHPFQSGGYWSVYVNGHFQNVGGCQVVVHDGDEVLWFASDDPYTAGTGGYDEPVILTAPAKLVPGQAFTVTVKDAVTTFDPNTFEGTTQLQPAQGATVTAGAASATTGADGTATLTVADHGPVTIVATHGNRAPDRAVACSSDGADGFCGTTATDAGGQATPTSDAAPCRTSGDDGRCGSPDKRAAYGFISSIATGKRYAKGHGPRELTGRVDDEPSGIADVRLRLTRNDHGRCATYDGKREAFVAMKRCGAAGGRWFSAGTLAKWRYLLPERLGSGRYVLDVQVVDKAGNADSTLARGRNRVVFFVG